MTIKRTDKYIPIPTEEQIAEIKRLNGLFYENDHNLLRGGKMKTKDKKALDSLYYEFLYKVDNHDWSKDLIDMELDNLKRDFVCKNNSNKAHWSKSIILGWIADLPKRIDAEYLYYTLTSREANQRVIKFAYWVS
jgi:hypothetical protein